ncbi:MAG: hypothetical protein ABW364_15590 [Rhodococcus fascians]
MSWFKTAKPSLISGASDSLKIPRSRRSTAASDIKVAISTRAANAARRWRITGYRSVVPTHLP